MGEQVFEFDSSAKRPTIAAHEHSSAHISISDHSHYFSDYSSVALTADGINPDCFPNTSLLWRYPLLADPSICWESFYASFYSANTNRGKLEINKVAVLQPTKWCTLKK